MRFSSVALAQQKTTCPHPDSPIQSDYDLCVYRRQQVVRGSSAPRSGRTAFSRRPSLNLARRGEPPPLHPSPFCRLRRQRKPCPFPHLRPSSLSSLMGGPPMTANDNPAPAARRSGSEKRQRSKPVSVRFLPSERAAVEEKAREVGLSLASFLRACGLGTPGPRARRSPSINAEALARATAALNKVGSNLNQIAHVLNAGGAARTAQECFAALAETRAAAAAIRQIVGRRNRP
jgi:hypothetical protein